MSLYAEPLPSRTFCLVSDSDIHINMMLGGYLDSRTAGAPQVHPGAHKGPQGKGGAPKAARVWIRELAVMWGKAGPGQKQHVLRLAARPGPEAERGAGFMGRIEVDGTEMPHISVRRCSRNSLLSTFLCPSCVLPLCALLTVTPWCNCQYS